MTAFSSDWWGALLAPWKLGVPPGSLHPWLQGQGGWGVLTRRARPLAPVRAVRGGSRGCALGPTFPQLPESQCHVPLRVQGPKCRSFFKEQRLSPAPEAQSRAVENHRRFPPSLLRIRLQPVVGAPGTRASRPSPGRCGVLRTLVLIWAEHLPGPGRLPDRRAGFVTHSGSENLLLSASQGGRRPAAVGTGDNSEFLARPPDK